MKKKLQKLKMIQAVTVGGKIYIYAVTDTGKLILCHDPEGQVWTLIDSVEQKPQWPA